MSAQESATADASMTGLAPTGTQPGRAYAAERLGVALSEDYWRDLATKAGPLAHQCKKACRNQFPLSGTSTPTTRRNGASGTATNGRKT